MVQVFEKFPIISKCPICNTNDNKSCFLMPVDDTDDGLLKYF